MNRTIFRGLALFAMAAALFPTDHLSAQQPGSTLRVGLVTMGPGAQVWEKFGHNAILVEDTLSGTKSWYNYGMFSFAQENFILKFAQGRMEYWMEGRNPLFDLPAYIQQDRAVWVQYLRLTPSQRWSLKTFLENNDTAENRFYRYDYYRDNCSTRIRDAIDLVLGGQLHEQTKNAPTDRTLRFHTQRLTTADPIIYTALMLALGPGVDRPISEWEEMFLPLATREIFQSLTVTTTDGAVLPLVESEETLFASDVWTTDEAPPRWTLRYLMVGLVLALIIGVLGIRSTACPWARTGFVLVCGLWTLLVGLGGIVLSGLWLATDHTVAYWNDNLFLLNPFVFALAVLLPFVALKRQSPARHAPKFAMIALALCSIGLVLQLVPGIGQVNGQMYALFLLPNLAAAASIIRLSWWVQDGALPNAE